MSTKSTGRGGAGNIGPEESKKNQPGPPAASLETPKIKSDVYTTGRGGSGNMALNDPQRPELARKAQDVEGPIAKPEPRGGIYHHGRGGGGNVVKAESSRSKSREKAPEKEKDKGEDDKEQLQPIVGTKKKERSGSSNLMEMAKGGLERVRRGSTTKKETG